MYNGKVQMQPCVGKGPSKLAGFLVFNMYLSG